MGLAARTEELMRRAGGEGRKLVARAVLALNQSQIAELDEAFVPLTAAFQIPPGGILDGEKLGLGGGRMTCRTGFVVAFACVGRAFFRLARLLDAAAAADMLGWENSGFSVDAFHPDHAQ